ncbi:FkbM family methyltransferase [Winogradskyella sp. 3972H.M.0a.05]|uniref:FkbM family methyltransferase n=1 Tax=Winogradskyella sp. 3972H.M.0a.05 TaxID=2950277 RepID=UPI0033932EF5
MKPLKFYKKYFRSQIRKRILGPHAVGIIYDSKNGLISMSLEDVIIGKHLGFKGNWGIEEVENLLELVSEEDSIYVIGTHVGTTLIPLAKKAKHVVGYEANPTTYQYLEINKDLNKLSNVNLFNLAVGDEAKKISFYQNTINSGASKIRPVKEFKLYTYDSPNVVEVDMVTIDDHIKAANLPAPTGAVIDIEGAEYFALKGMQSYLQSMKFLYIEFIAHHLQYVSSVSIEEFLGLITPHFTKVKSKNGNKIYDISKTTGDLIEYCQYLFETNKSDDFLFTKD